MAGCGWGADDVPVVTFPGSAVGAEAELVERQIARFRVLHPEIEVRLQRTPDDATQRHQLYVQRLNARSDDPDVLQLDVVWTPEFAAAGWLLPLDRLDVATEAFFPATVRANTWNGRLYAVPWFVDVGMLYWRTDLMDAAPETMDGMVARALDATGRTDGPARGLVWQGARYEGLVTVFLEHLGAFGGRIMTEGGDVVVDSPEAVRALTFMRYEIYDAGIVPREALTWHEEETRFAFQNGSAAMMRNWPYAYALMSREDSRVAGRFDVAPMPAAPGGRSTATLGGSQLAISATSDAPEAAWKLIAYLTAPDQVLERAEVAGQFPAIVGLYDDPRLAAALEIPPDRARLVIEAATPRPVTPIYTQLSEILQIELHRALVRQATPEEALERAAARMRATIESTGIDRLTGRAGR